MDDGTYVIEDGKVIGRQSLETAEMNEDVALGSRIEPMYIYAFRYFVLFVGFFLLFIIMFIAAIGLIFLCYLLTDKIADRGQIYDEARLRRNGQLMNLMKKIPFSQFMLHESRDCSICLESLESQDEVVQLKCSKYHLFHAQCMEGYINQGTQYDRQNKKCPLCRKPVEYEENPVNFEGGSFGGGDVFVDIPLHNLAQ